MWAIKNIRFLFFYIMNTIAGSRSGEHFEGKEKTIKDWSEKRPDE